MAGFPNGSPSSSPFHLHLHQPQLNNLPEPPEPEKNEWNTAQFPCDGDVLARRPRGRPPGSKNKPKPPVVISRESTNTLRAHILEVGHGCDVFHSVAEYTEKRRCGICILSGSGMVTDVSLRQPAAAGGAPGTGCRRERGGGLTACGPVVVIAASFTDVAYDRVGVDGEEGLLMQPPEDESGGGCGLPLYNFPGINNLMGGLVGMPDPNPN
ncbi:AT-hook motif nuclear-localized protein 21 [Vitis vinifera]|uniref:AT-hook motif nuclear-localized protein 21 n=1 Tax=Vitis vinifera TaxID=29760 RepID=A0A438HT43_VITVI|nr:AT-hook motif nuclear-localized protein 21 [Vitis vinifera]